MKLGGAVGVKDYCVSDKKCANGYNVAILSDYEQSSDFMAKANINIIFIG